MLVRQAMDPDAWLYACDDSEQILGRKNDYVPSHLFGQNPYVREYADKNKVPLLGALGGARNDVSGIPCRSQRCCRSRSRGEGARCCRPGPPQASRAPDPTPNDGKIHVLCTSPATFTC